MNRFVLIFALVVAMVAGIGVAMLQRKAPEMSVVMLFEQPRELPALRQVVDHNNQAVNTGRFRERWDILFFGFTHCPDICPATLAQLRQAIANLPSDRRPRIWLVSVDPQRDRPGPLKDYVEHFGEDFAGITGSETGISTLASALGVAFQKIQLEDSYTMEHSGALFLLDPQGRYAGIISTPHSWPDIAADLRRLR